MPTFYSGWQNHFRARTDVTLLSQNVANNTSTIRVIGYIEAEGGWFFNNATINAGTYLDGSNVASDSAGRTVGSGGVVDVIASTHTVTHSGDGSKVINVSVNSASASPWVTFNQWAGGDYRLPTIARATTPTWSGSFTAGVAKTINLPRASGGFTHDVRYAFGNLTGTIATGAGASTSWTPSLDLLTQIPRAASGTGSITVVTKSGSTTIGSKAVQFTLVAGSDAVPIINGTLWDDMNTTVKNRIGAFVQSLSQVLGTVDSEGYYGSTIAREFFQIGTTQLPEGVPLQIEGSGVVAAVATVIDTRARTVTQDASFNVLPYEAPRANNVVIRRADAAGAPLDAGTYLRMDLNAVVHSLKVGGVEKNSMTVKIRTKGVDAPESAWVSRNTLTAGLTYDGNVLITGGGVFIATDSYDVEVTISDGLGRPYIHLTTVTTGTVTIDLNGTNVGIGKFHERGGLDVSGDIYSNGTVMCPVGGEITFYGSTAPAGWAFPLGQSLSKTTYPELFDVIGYTYGGSGTSFNLPDPSGTTAVTRKAGDSDFGELGNKPGTKTVTLTTPQIPSHTHTQNAHSHAVTSGGQILASGTGPSANLTTGGGSYALTNGSAATAVNQPTGGGGAHNNIQPSFVVNKIMRLI